MRRCFHKLLCIASAAGLAAVAAAESRVAVAIPEGLPLEIVATDFANTEFEPRGGALVIELTGSIRFRHTGGSAVRALTLAVDTRSPGLGGRAAVAAPSLHARKGEEFEIPLNLRMLRPLPLPAGPAVHIAPDAILFDTLEAAGPDRLDSVRKMTVRELEARRDRRHFLARWEAGGREELVAAMHASLQRQAARPRLDVRLAGTGPATAGSDPREVRFALVQDEAAPLELLEGTALVRGVVSDTPRIRIRNRSAHPVRHFEVGWLVEDSAGAVYSVGAAPFDTPPRLAPGERYEATGSRKFALRPTGSRNESKFGSMTAYIRNARLEDGTVWIPSRHALDAARILGAVPVSDEERRLTQLYRERGSGAVVDELHKLASRSGDNVAR